MSPELHAVADPAADAPAFRMRGLSLGYGDRAVVREVDLDIPHGGTTVLIGANGCGKTTLLKGLSRQLKPLAGTLEADGRGVREWHARQYARSVSLLPQSPVVPEGLTVAELVERGRHPHRRWWGAPSPDDDAAVARAMELTELTALAGRPVEELSGGQRQRVWIALSLAQRARTMLLDEPTSYLDLAHQVDLLDMLRGLEHPDGPGRATVVAVLHELNLAARVADRLVAMAAGRIVAVGSPAEVLTPELLAEVFGLRADVARDPVGGRPVVLPRGRAREGPHPAPPADPVALDPAPGARPAETVRNLP
jgi:iron complex transport system ATP-binding protein